MDVTYAYCMIKSRNDTQNSARNANSLKYRVINFAFNVCKHFMNTNESIFCTDFGESFGSSALSYALIEYRNVSMLTKHYQFN